MGKLEEEEQKNYHNSFLNPFPNISIHLYIYLSTNLKKKMDKNSRKANHSFLSLRALALGGES